MRIAIAEFKQETNTFVPFTTTVQTFEEQYLHRGDAMLTAFGNGGWKSPARWMRSRRQAPRRCRCWPPWRWRPARWSARRSSTS